MLNIIHNPMNNLLQSALSAASTRQKTISNNIANVDTPNYKAKKTIFTHELKSAMENEKIRANRTDARHIPFKHERFQEEPAKVVTRFDTQMNHNGNNVDIDLEMAELAKNQIYYNALVDRLNGRFNSIRTVLGRGG